jgi:HAD superfamily hydrolase (TIGR01549 family)
MILFDLDGTLVDSANAILGAYRAAIRAVAGYDIDPDAEHVHDLLRRRPKEYFRQHYPPLADEMATQYASNYRSETVVAFPGAETLVAELAGRKALGIVSNKGRARILSDLGHVGIDAECFAVIIGAEDTLERKPHPAPILKALEAGCAVPQGAIYVGDGPHDMLAAKAAGLMAVGVTWGYYPVAAIVEAGADATVDDVTQLAAFLLGKGQ